MLELSPLHCSSPRILFVDMNSFFASVEQQENPELRGLPIIVVPMIAKTTCAIAASYPAKAFGIRTGTSVADALKLCPDVKVIPARPKIYIEYHNKILEVLKNHFSDPLVLSVDEMACPLADWQRKPEVAEEMAYYVKRDFERTLGVALQCSIGVAPNIFLAKVASDVQKPNGLTFFIDNYENDLFKLTLRDLPGIGRNMEARLSFQGITSVEQLWNLSPNELYHVWGSVVGERWYYMLRGSLEYDYHSAGSPEHKSVSHSHVFAPQFRTVPGAQAIMFRLMAKALKRLRSYELTAKGIDITVSYRCYGNYKKKKILRMTRTVSDSIDDDIFWAEILKEFTDQLPEIRDYKPAKGCIVFFDLQTSHVRQLNFLDDRTRYRNLSRTMDEINQKFGHVVDLASGYFARREAPVRIAFNKVRD